MIIQKMCLFSIIIVIIAYLQETATTTSPTTTSETTTFETITSEMDRLQAARAQFNKINHGCYAFQYVLSCFCWTCSTQAMDIKVINNQVEQVTYAEGNDFALDNFCGGNEDIFNSTLETSSKTIDDLFDLIEDAVIRSLPMSVNYHDTIGIPLSLYIDRVPGGIDDEIAYRVNCIEFINSSNCHGNARQIKNFTEKDDYSCNNVDTPDHCLFRCNRLFDGCNTCSCDGEDIIGCSKRVCQDYYDETCFQCESNTQWNTCGKYCHPTCNVPCTSDDDDCNSPTCQCPDSLPIWNGFECVTQEQCPNTTTTIPTISTTQSTIPIISTTPTISTPQSTIPTITLPTISTSSITESECFIGSKCKNIDDCCSDNIDEHIFGIKCKAVKKNINTNKSKNKKKRKEKFCCIDKGFPCQMDKECCLDKKGKGRICGNGVCQKDQKNKYSSSESNDNALVSDKKNVYDESPKSESDQTINTNVLYVLIAILVIFVLLTFILFCIWMKKIVTAPSKINIETLKESEYEDELELVTQT